MTALICEDLARIEPAQRTLRAIGPNLVLGLLMDGPQLPSRWPARYATVLADDPGCSVLTLTSLALVRRSMERRNQTGNYAIGLWKEFGEAVHELKLPRTAHGLILLLSMVRERTYTPDGRPDTFAKELNGIASEEGATVRIRLTGTQTVAASHYAIPDHTNGRFPAFDDKSEDGEDDSSKGQSNARAIASMAKALLEGLDKEGGIPSAAYYPSVHGDMRAAIDAKKREPLDRAIKWLKANG